VSLPTNTRPPHCVRHIQTADSRRRCCHVPKIQHGSQPTGSTNISESTTDIVEIPTATTTFSGSIATVALLPSSPDVDLSRKSNMAAKLPEVLTVSPLSDVRVSLPTNTRPPHCVRHFQTADSRRRRCLATIIQDGSQPTVSTNLRSYETYRQNSNGYIHIFPVELSNGGTSDVVARRSLPELQHGRRTTGSTNTFMVSNARVSFPTSTRPCDCVQHIQTADSRRRCCLATIIQDGGQPTGSTNIYETTKHIVKIPTATPAFSTEQKTTTMAVQDSTVTTTGHRVSERNITVTY